VLIERAMGQAILAAVDGTVVTASDLVVRETRSLGGSSGWGVSISMGARFEGERVLAIQNSELGIYALDEGTELVLSNSVVRETHASEFDGTLGWGIGVAAGAHLLGSSLLIEESRDTGIIVLNPGSEAVLSDVLVRATQTEEASGTLGSGVFVKDGGRLEADRLCVRGNPTGIAEESEDAEIVMRDLVVLDTIDERDSTGRGILILGGSRFEATRFLVARSRDVGILAGFPGTTVTLTDGVVRETAPRASDGFRGRGVEAGTGSRLDATRLLVTDVRDVGLLVLDEFTEASVTDVLIQNVRSREGDGFFGYGMEVSNGPRTTGERLRIDGVQGLGLMSATGASADLRDVEVANVTPISCDCPAANYGDAIIAVGGSLRLASFDVHEAESCGLFVVNHPLAPGIPALDVMSGVVSQTSIGACVQVDGYDLDRLTADVVYIDNGTNLDSTMLPVPDVSAVTEETDP
jgi:hypothetical protein